MGALQRYLSGDLLLLRFEQCQLRGQLMALLLRGGALGLQIAAQCLALGAQVRADVLARVAHGGAVGLAGNLQQRVAAMYGLALLDIDSGDDAAGGGGDIQEAGRRHQLSFDVFTLRVLAEDHEQHDGQGDHGSQRGEHPTRQRRGDMDGAQPVTALGIQDFLSEKLCHFPLRLLRSDGMTCHHEYLRSRRSADRKSRSGNVVNRNTPMGLVGFLGHPTRQHAVSSVRVAHLTLLHQRNNGFRLSPE